MVLPAVWQGARPRALSRKRRVQGRRRVGANHEGKGQALELGPPGGGDRFGKVAGEGAEGEDSCYRNQDGAWRDQLLRPEGPGRHSDEVVPGLDVGAPGHRARRVEAQDQGVKQGERRAQWLISPPPGHFFASR
jgi:hypothetical protein